MSRIPQRRRIFVGCEGESEGSYVALLGRLSEDRNCHVHLDRANLRGGDPLAIVEAAVREFRSRVRRRGPYAAQAVFLDADRRAIAPERAGLATDLATRFNITLIWQEPCHEAFLLRHLPDCERLRPPTAQAAMMELQRRWPDYEKAMPAVSLATRLSLDAVLRAAAVEASLRDFLIAIGLLADP